MKKINIHLATLTSVYLRDEKMQKKQKNISEMEAGYRRAMIFQNAVADIKKLALNTTLVPHWIEDTDLFWYRRETKSGVQFRLVDANSATNQIAFDHQILASSLSKALKKEVNANRLPITGVTITLAPLRVLFQAFDKRYCFDEDTQQCIAAEPKLDTHSSEKLVSPDGKKVAFTKNYNLWIKNLETDDEYPLTKSGEKYYGYACAPITWGVPMNSDIQACWSPNSKTLLTVQTDNRHVNSTPIIDYVPKDGSVRPTLTKYRCAYPGDEYVEEQRLLAIDVESGLQKEANYRRVPVNRSAYGLFTDNLCWWSSNSRHSYFIDMERGDQIVRLVEFDTQTGATRILFEEFSSTYFNLSPSEAIPATLLPLPASNELVWFSERSGWAHLYLYDLNTGTLKNPITKGNWMVRELLYFDKDRRELWFQAGGRVKSRDPYYLDICRVNIDKGQTITVVSSDHEYTVLGSLGLRTTASYFLSTEISLDFEINTCGVSPNGKYVIATRSRADQVPVSILFDRNGNEILNLETAIIDNLPEEWQWPEPVKLIAADDETDIYGTVFRPSNFSPDKQYPIIDCSISSGELAAAPKGSFTNAIFAGLWYLEAAALAELGFIVVTIDGRGTAFRDREFVDVSYGRMFSYNLADDRIQGIKQLAKRYPYMDLDRVGIMGFNGFGSAVYGMLEHPDFFKVGVSHALQDARLMSIVVGEVYEGTEHSVTDNSRADQLAYKLQGKLLLMHGLIDRMDHCAATWRLVDALQKANKDFDLLVLPNEGVGIEGGGHISSPYAFRRTWDYFVYHLQGVIPPKEFKCN